MYNVFGHAARILERSHGGEYVEERGHLEIAFVYIKWISAEKFACECNGSCVEF